jgi:hypothetical protein
MKCLILSVLILSLVAVCSAQTSSFTYQGKLADAGVAADGVYDITFKLYDASANGTQVGTDVVRDNVLVTDGIFSVDLDFGATAFADGGSRYLQIEVRPGASSGAFTPLVPRQPITSAPYSVKTTNATTADGLSSACISCVTDTNIATVGAGKITGVVAQSNGGTGLSTPGAAGNFLRSDGTSWTSSPFQASDIPILTGSFILNSTSTQPTSNFSISGTGRASIFNALTQYNIGGQRALYSSGGNLFVGGGSGTSNTGAANSFLGANAGFSNTDGFSNSFVGNSAGSLNSSGSNNSFVGSLAGSSNTTGFGNSFFGSSAGVNNDTAGFNSFFGWETGRQTTTGSNNSFFGMRAGYGNTTESENSYFGSGTGNSGFANSFFGATTGSSNTGSYNSFFGRAVGSANTTGGGNAFFGGDSGQNNTTGSNNTNIGMSAGSTNTTGSNNTTIGSNANFGANNLNYATAIGSDAVVSSSNSVVLGRNLDTVRIPGNLNLTGSFTGSFTVPTTNITGVVSQANGGTGLASPGAAGNFLRSDGTNWTSSAFQPSDIPVLSTSFIQNLSIGQQSGSFNIDGGGNANTFNATTQYNIGGNRVLSAPGTENLFGGVGAGQSNTTGASNTFFGTNAGFANTFGGLNTFFGFEAGQYNLFGDSNSFFGRQAGHLNTSGSFNSAFGALAGQRNSQGHYITTIGALADVENLTAFPDNATAIGAFAYVSQDNSLVLGSINGVNSCGPPFCDSVNVGIGTTAPQQRLHVNGNEILSTGTGAGFKFRDRGSTSATDDWVWFSSGNTARFFRAGVGDLLGIQTNGNVGIGTTSPAFRLDVVGRSRVRQKLGDVASANTAGLWLFQNAPNQDQAFIGMEDDFNVGFYGSTGGWGLVMSTVTGVTAVRTLGASGIVPLCWNALKEISTCGSSLRYKTNIGQFGAGMSFVNQLRPISFDWKAGGMKDIGFGAEDIAKIDPRFVTYNDKGEVEGVKYDRLTTVFVNAFREQQTDIDSQKSVIRDQQRQIEDLNSKIKLQQSQIDALKRLVCAQNESAEICKEEK